jgi:hypothetical protein
MTEVQLPAEGRIVLFVITVSKLALGLTCLFSFGYRGSFLGGKMAEIDHTSIECQCIKCMELF